VTITTQPPIPASSAKWPPVTEFLPTPPPDVIQAVTGETVTHDELGGADVHAAQSGVAHFAYDDEQTCLEDVRYLISLLPANNNEPPPASNGAGEDRYSGWR